MTTAFPRLTADPSGPSPQNAPTLDALTTALDGMTITQGWDVVHAMSAGKVNDLLQRQFVMDLAEHSNLPPVDGKVLIAGNLSVELVDLVLGSPLIAFQPKLSSGTAAITIPVVSGLAHLVAQTGPETTVLSTQWISQAAGYSITGFVPLATATGHVEGGHDVRLQIESGRNFVSDLGMPGAAGTFIGSYLLSFLQQHATGYGYSLGTIDYSSNGTGLTPTTFSIATQVDATDPTDSGRVLLFIATTYNPGVGAQTVLARPNIVPVGMDTTLLVASATLFGGIIRSAVGPTFGGAVSTVQLGTGASVLTSTGGSADAGEVSYTTYSELDEYGSGTCQQKEDVVAALAGVTFSPARIAISASWNGSWSQSWYHRNSAGKYSGCDDTTMREAPITMRATLHTAYTPSVDPASSTVSFAADANASVGFDHSGALDWILGDGDARDTLGEQVQNAVNKELQGVFHFTLPDVQAFAVSSLLFPGEQVSSFEEVRVPGDLLLCGTLDAADLGVSPALQEVVAGGSATYTASGPVKWSASLGQIGDDGTYTAPARPSRATVDVITASSTSDASQQAYAAAIVVPAQVLVSPLVAVTQPQYAPQQFEASLPGSSGAPSWSLTPEVGQIDTNGLFTPPDTLSGPTVVTVTATVGGATGTATILITPQAPAGLAIEPYATVPLGPGHQQQFTATADNQSITPNWSLWPPGGGSIDATGLYRAPAAIDVPQGIVLMATSPRDPTLTGTAVILLAPTSDWVGSGIA
jgi:hypothetical protein